MEKFQESREKATRHLKIADHMLVITYPLVNDPKLLMTVLDNVLKGMLCSVDSLLYYERLFKRINMFGEGVEERLRIFKHLAQKYQLDPGFIRTVVELKDIMREHRNSPMEFARKDKFIIYTANQNLKTINQASIKKYVSTAKKFLEAVNKVTVENERLFR
ncbi:MAG: hypothetical protein KKG59_04150 [Nanoarchaeota archaeon]|nr:hypothetical protein [Nanoarchaeota archaeon]